MKKTEFKEPTGYLRGGGEMGELTRGHNWPNTSAGAIETWPLSLRVHVNMMLQSRFPMLIFWGRDLLTFYNDAFRPSLGSDGKHPSSLGQPGEQSWAESWPVIGPMIDNIMAGGESVWFEDQKLPIYREGSMGYAYWTYSLSPLANDEGQTCGVLVTCMETTRLVENVQELEQSKHRFRDLVDKAQSPICILKGEEMVLEIGNEPLFAVWQTNRSALGQPLLQILPELAGQPIIGWLRDVYRKGVTLDLTEVPAQLERKGGEVETRYFNFMYQPYREADGTISGVMAMATDVTDHVLNRQQLEESRRQLLSLFDQLPVAIALLNKDRLTVNLANAFYCEIIDKKHDEIIGRPLLDVLPEMAGQRFDELMNAVMTTGIPYTANEVPAQLVRNGQLETFYVNLRYNPVKEGDGSISGVLVVATDLTQTVQARQKIEETAKKLNTLIQSASVAVGLFIGRDLIIETPNEAFIEIVGRGPHIAGKPLRSVMPELESQPFLQILDGIFSSGEPFKMYGAKLLIQRSDELLERYFDVTFSPIFDEHGSVTAILDISVDVTEQVLNRKRIEESESRFRSLIEEAPVATCLFVGPEMRVEVINEMMVQAWGKTFSVLNKPLIEALPELKGQPFIDLLANVYATGVAYKGIAAPVDLVINGRLDTYYYDFTYKPLLNDEGQVWAIINVSINVTDRVLAIRRLEESELFARNIIDNSPVAMVVFTGEQMEISTINQNMLQMLGRDESIIGRSFLDVMPELVATPLMERLRRVYATGETFTQPEEQLRLLKEGQPYSGYYQYIYKPLRNTAGDIYGVITTATEITPQVLARKKIEETEKALRGAIELAELATWRIDTVTKDVTYSPRLQEWLGNQASLMQTGGSPNIHEKDRGRIHSAIMKALEPTGTGHFDEVYTIVNLLTGKERIIHANGSLVYDEKGSLLGLAGTAQDITVQKNLQLALEAEVAVQTEELAQAVQNLEDANKQLLRSNEELAQYAYVASHDLQEPLRKIKLFSNLLTTEQSPMQQGEIIAKIMRSTDRMSLLIHDLLEFSRLLKSDALFRPLDLRALVTDVIGDFELLIAEKQADVNVGQLPIIEGVVLQMNQLFSNLIGNALKFTKTGTTPFIAISSRRATREEVSQHVANPVPDIPYHLIAVEDNGIGFDQIYLEQIFEVFRRLHGRDEYSGSGIGLAICRRVVQNHQGGIFAEAKSGEGARFYILLPERQSSQPSTVAE